VILDFLSERKRAKSDERTVKEKSSLIAQSDRSILADVR
jgi:hypothetical protein